MIFRIDLPVSETFAARGDRHPIVTRFWSSLRVPTHGDNAVYLIRFFS